MKPDDGTNKNFDKDFDEIFSDGGAPGGGIGIPLPRGLAVMMQAIGSAGERVITGDEVETHEGKKILIPENMTYEMAQRILKRVRQDSETPTEFDRQYLYRPDDGAYATYQVLRKRYGSVLGDAQKIETLFGTMERPAQLRSVAVGYGKTERVPWGQIGIPTLEGVEMVLCDRHPHPEYGQVFEIHVTAAKKYKTEILEIFDEIEQYLKDHSIYRGKVVVGSADLEFLDLSGFDPSKIVFADQVERQFTSGVMTVLKYADSLREEGVPLKQASLLYGPHGTGKTSALQIVAQVAEANGWTVIFAKTGEDDLQHAIRTARLYMPALVVVEDIDVEASTAEDNEVRRLLETFDGITAKGGELVMVMTTNHIDRIHPGMLRPGRFDFVIEVDKLDRGGVERLIKAVVSPDKLSKDIDYDVVGTAMEGFSPAFVRGSCDRAVTFAVARLEGRRNYTITTSDLVDAAESLRPQLELQQGATGGEKPPTLDAALVSAVEPVVRKVLSSTGVHYPDNDLAYKLVVSSNGSGRHVGASA